MVDGVWSQYVQALPLASPDPVRRSTATFRILANDPASNRVLSFRQATAHLKLHLVRLVA